MVLRFSIPKLVVEKQKLSIYVVTGASIYYLTDV